MKIFSDDYVDDGTVYDLIEEKEDISALLEKKFNYHDLNRKYELLAKEKEIILEACVEKEKESPNIEIIKKALSIISQYESDYTKLKQTKAKKVENIPPKELNYSAVEKEHNVLTKITIIAFLLGPVGLLRVSWALALALFLMALVFLNIIPELLLSVPFISASLAWGVTKKRAKREQFYHNKSYVQEPVFIMTQKKSPFKKYNLFLKKKKILWLAALLGFLFGGLGLFYVSWLFALAMLMITITMALTLPILLISVPMISLALALYAGIETNKKLLYMN